MIYTLIQFFASLTLLVVIHEFGHFITAKIFGVRVEKFYIFFNPGFSLFKFKPKSSDTTYGIGWLPLGGYVKLSGMIDESFDTDQMKEEPKDWEFRTKPAWQRLIIMVAGVVMNFLLAIAIYTGIAFHWGDTYLPMENATDGMEYCWSAHEVGFVDGDKLVSADGKKIKSLSQESVREIVEATTVQVERDGAIVDIAIPDSFMTMLMREGKGFAFYRVPFVVQKLIDGMPAAEAGLQADDRLLTINGQSAYLTQAMKQIASHKNKSMEWSVLRGADTVKLTVTPDIDGKVGVYMKSPYDLYEMEHVEYSLMESFPHGLKTAVEKIKGYVSDFKYVFTPEGVQTLGGFGTVASLFPETFDFYAFWTITAFLSLVLAFMNFLPIPALDGGHILFVLIEIITRKKVSQDVLMKAQMIGVTLLLTLMLFVNLNDITRLFK
ncbi:MAG: RIP metalloprotease RseP [Bacteroidales bacterium]|jgi:regulator of sigma E protease|nr:RIP metalloprotease RseP [Bacteroidales bacterium]